MILHLIIAGKYENRKNWSHTWEKCYNSLAKIDCGISIWTNEGIDTLLQEDDKEFYEKYLIKIPNIYKWDYVRYIILEKYGGAYFDMDIEIIDPSFIKKLHPKKIYLMEGTGGTHVENSIMISPLNEINKQIWQRMKLFAKNKIMNHFEKCEEECNVIWIVGTQLLSEYFIKHSPFATSTKNHRDIYDILAWEHFGNTKSTLSYTKHWQTSTWNK